MLGQPHPPGSHSPEEAGCFPHCVFSIFTLAGVSNRSRSINVCLVRERVRAGIPRGQSLDFTKLKQLLQPGGCNILRKEEEGLSPQLLPPFLLGGWGSPSRIWEDKGNWLPVSPDLWPPNSFVSVGALAAKIHGQRKVVVTAPTSQLVYKALSL